MRTACTIGTLAVFTALVSAPLAPRTLAQNPPQRQSKPAAAAAPAAPADALMYYSAGIDAMLSDPKDQALAKALKMLDDRVAELPRELQQPQIPGPALQMLLQLLMNPMGLRAGLLDMQAEPQGPPFYAQLSFYGSAETANDFAGRLSGILAQVGAPPAQPAPNMPGLQMMDANGVPVYFGTMKAGGDVAAAGGSAFVIALNKTTPADVKIDTSGLPSGVKPTFAFMLDARQLQPIMDMMLAQAGPEADAAKKQLAMSGLYGENAAQITVAAGDAKDRSHLAVKFTNYRKTMENTGLLPHGAIGAADLKRIPADATFAQIGKANLSGMAQMIGSMAGEAMNRAQGGAAGEAPPDIFSFIEQSIGINPKRDIIDHLGETMGMYASDTTGGGGLASMVAFMEVKDADALNQSLARIRGMLNQIGQQQARGYVRIAERDLGGQKVMSLIFAGLPVPLEICWGVSDGWMYVGSPNALQAAIAQAKSGKNSLADNPRFKEMGGSDLKDAIKVSFVDTPRLIASGYGLVSMGAAALANAVRSPSDLHRDPGVIMPAYNDLVKDAHAMVMVQRFAGNDLVMSVQADRSCLVNACGIAGSVGGAGGAVAAAALAAGVAMPSMTRARAAAGDMQDMSALRNISMGYAVYANDKNDALPTSADDLIKGNYLTPDMLHPAGGADFWLNPHGGRISAIADPSHYIIAYDRTMYAGGKHVAVAFLDGHVEMLGLNAFRDLTQSDAHKGIDFNLPL